MKIHFGTGNSSAEDYYYIQINTATASALGVGNAITAGSAGYTISTQSAAQVALEAIDTAIASKDNIRANLGALANRLNNTISNLSIQAENLQAAESRISDVDVATEMTEFVRNQILTQASVAMLAQANTLPQLALTLIGG
jgi:flagellin